MFYKFTDNVKIIKDLSQLDGEVSLRVVVAYLLLFIMKLLYPPFFNNGFVENTVKK